MRAQSSCFLRIKTVCSLGNTLHFTWDFVSCSPYKNKKKRTIIKVRKKEDRGIVMFILTHDQWNYAPTTLPKLYAT